MLAILIFAVPLTGLASLATGIQNARDRFFWPAASSAFGSVGNIVVLLALYRWAGPLALAWGYLVSEGLKASVTVIPVLRHGWTRLLTPRDPRVREMARLMAPFILFGILTRSTSVFERYFASGLPDGDLSYLGYANKISSIVMTLLGTGIAAAVFPAMARAYTKDGKAGLVGNTEYGYRLTVAVALPVLAVLSAVAVPAVTVLFERGAFEHVASLATGRIVPIVMVGAVVFRMVGSLISRTFYVTKDTHTVPITVGLTTVLYVVLAKALTASWGYVGLALAEPLYSGLGIVVLSLLIVRRLRIFRVGRLARDTLMYGVASLAAFGVARLVSAALAFLPALVELVAATSAGAALYIAIMFLIDRDVAVSILELAGVQRVLAGATGAFRRTVASRG